MWHYPIFLGPEGIALGNGNFHENLTSRLHLIFNSLILCNIEIEFLEGVFYTLQLVI